MFFNCITARSISVHRQCLNFEYISADVGFELKQFTLIGSKIRELVRLCHKNCDHYNKIMLLRDIGIRIGMFMVYNIKETAVIIYSVYCTFVHIASQIKNERVIYVQ